MTISIQLLSNQVTTQTNKAGKPMQVLEVAYKNLTFQGKVESKKLFDFGVQAESFKTLVTASPTQVFDVEVVKNNAGYNDWTKVTRGNATAPSATTPSARPAAGSAAPTAQTKGGWETPEERAKKQVYIIRQSSLNTAVQALTINTKANPKAEDIIDLAKRFEEYVFSGSDTEASSMAAADVGTIESIPEDLPF